jgi:hypothetical protein
MSIRELDSRTIDGITTRLLWAERDGRVFVDVVDAKSGDAFALEVQDPSCALDVFHHPYAYDATEGAKARLCACADGVDVNVR